MGASASVAPQEGPTEAMHVPEVGLSSTGSFGVAKPLTWMWRVYVIIALVV